MSRIVKSSGSWYIADDAGNFYPQDQTAYETKTAAEAEAQILGNERAQDQAESERIERVRVMLANGAGEYDIARALNVMDASRLIAMTLTPTGEHYEHSTHQ
mgnify:CR=1 FL=1